eukprot:3717637-Prymnesium_polylepis.1
MSIALGSWRPATAGKSTPPPRAAVQRATPTPLVPPSVSSRTTPVPRRRFAASSRRKSSLRLTPQPRTKSSRTH